MRLIITKEITTTTTEKISVRIDDSRATILLDKEKETEAVSEVLKAADTILNLNSKQE